MHRLWCPLWLWCCCSLSFCVRTWKRGPRLCILPRSLFAQLGIGNMYLRSHYLTSERFILYLEWKECRLTVWSGPCFTVHWTASGICTLASRMLGTCSLKGVCVCVCVCCWGGWGSDCDLGMPSVPLRTTLLSPDQSNAEPQAPSWDPRDLLEVPVTGRRWNHNCAHRPSWDVC